MKKIYFAYGSNLSLDQMSYRCPHGIPIAKGFIEDYRLKFKGSGSGSYLTIEPAEGFRVPVVCWEIDEVDERHLDAYEGCPRFYYKKEITVHVESLFDGFEASVVGIVYIMHEDRLNGVPSDQYFETCAEGYRRFGFPKKFLVDAFNFSKFHYGKS